MPPQFYPLVLLVPGVAAVLTANYAWRRRQVPTAGALAAAMASVAIWSLGVAGEMSCHTLTAAMQWVKVEYLGIATIPVLWVVFALHYAGRGDWLTRRRLLLLGIVPAITICLVATNELHHLYYRAVRLTDMGGAVTVVPTPGPGYLLHVVYSYLLVVAGLVAIARVASLSGPKHRAQSLFVLGAALAPWITNVLYVLGISPIPGIDFTPFAFIMTGLALSWALFRLRLLDLAPIARDAVFEAIRDGVAVVDELDRIVDLNRAAQELLDCTPADALGRPMVELLPCWPEVRAYCDDAGVHRLKQRLGTGEAARSYEMRLFRLQPHPSQPPCVLLMMTDVSPEERAREALRAVEVSYHELFNAVGEAIYIQDRDGRFRDTNYAAEEMYGYPHDYLLGKSPADIAAPGRNDMAAIQGMIARAFAGVPQEFEFWGRRRDGEVFPKEVRLYSGTYEGEQVVIALARDIAERKQAEQRVHDALQRFEAIVENAPSVAIQGYDRRGVVRHWNRGSEELYGYAAADMIGHSLRGTLLDEEAHRQFLRAIERVFAQREGAWRQEWETTDRAGERHTVEAVILPVHEAGQVSEVFCIGVDITGRKRAEDAQRLAALGQLAAGVAHEFNNLLAAMLLQAEMADPNNVHEARELKEVVVRAARRGGATCADLMAFARPAETRREPVRLADTVERALAIAHRQIENAQVTVRCDLRTPNARGQGDAGQLEQVLLNLIINAVHAMESPQVALEARRLTVALDVAAGPRAEAVLSVADTGTGIAPEHLPRIFEPFFTTKTTTAEATAEPRGTGLGLSVSHGIIAAHDGRMEVTSEVGQGTTFVLRLPLLDEAEAAAQQAQAAAAATPDFPPSHILLAEDERDIRGPVLTALTQLGHSVTAVASTEEALAALAHSTFDAVVTDLMMPGEGGTAIVRQANSLPNPPSTIVITGQLDAQLSQHMAELGASALLQKPFTLSKLLETLAGQLARRES